MCLFLTVAALQQDANASRLKRVLKGASSLSVFADRSDDLSFSLGNDPHCSCDLHAGGPDGMGAGISIVSSAGDSLVKIAEAAIAAGFAPLEFRVFWGEQPEAEALELSLSEFCNIVAENSFSGRVAYLVSA